MLAAVIVILLAAVLTCGREPGVTLEFGMIAGSNWDVANADSCVIIDKAIEKFEKNILLTFRYLFFNLFCSLI